MRIVLTGASGFIGRRLARGLSGQGHQVVPVSRGQWDVAGSVFRPGVVEKSDAVIHLAGEPVAQRWTTGAKVRIRASRMQSTAKLVEAIQKAGRPPRVLVCASAIGYYGDRGEEILTEDSVPGTDFLAEVCRGWEAAAMKAAETGCRVVTMRTGIVLGRGGGALQKMLTPFRLGLGGPLGSGRQWMSWIHLEDLALAFERAVMDEGLTGAVNGTGPAPVRNDEFTRALGRALRRPAILRAPAFALKMMMGEMSGMLLGSQHVVPGKLLGCGFEFRYPVLQEAFGEILNS